MGKPSQRKRTPRKETCIDKQQRKISSFFIKSPTNSDTVFTNVRKPIQSKLTIDKGQARIIHKGQAKQPLAKTCSFGETLSHSNEQKMCQSSFKDVEGTMKVDRDSAQNEVCKTQQDKHKYDSRSFLTSFSKKPSNMSTTVAKQPNTGANKSRSTITKLPSKVKRQPNPDSETRYNDITWETELSAPAVSHGNKVSKECVIKHPKVNYISSAKSLSPWKQSNKRKQQNKGHSPRAKRRIVDNDDDVVINAEQCLLDNGSQIAENVPFHQTDDVLADILSEMKKDKTPKLIRVHKDKNTLSLSLKKAKKKLLKDEHADPDHVFDDIAKTKLRVETKLTELRESRRDKSKVKQQTSNNDDNKSLIENFTCHSNLSGNLKTELCNKEKTTSSTLKEEIETDQKFNETNNTSSLSFGGDESWMNDFDLSAMEDAIFSSTSKRMPFVSSLPLNHSYGRHKVTSIDYSSNGDKVLHVTPSGDGEVTKKCILQGFWVDTLVEVGDAINVLGEFDEQGICHVTDKQGVIVVNPDTLMSGTSVVSSMHCMRRAVLGEKFKGLKGGNVYMLQGSIVHSFFQYVVQNKLRDQKVIIKALDEILRSSRNLHDIYGIGLDEKCIREEAIKFIPNLQNWIKQYQTQEKNNASDDLKVTKIADIEENIWSPRFGIKGKIDVTVEVQDNMKSGRKLVPLELKTGKPSYSIEHKGQVTLYSMMMSERYQDPEYGLLLYLKDGSMKKIMTEQSHKSGLMQLRNELAYYMVHTMMTSLSTDAQADAKQNLKPLPRPINSERTCSKCPQLLNCSLYLRSIENLTLQESHSMMKLSDLSLAHLELSHRSYYAHWCNLIHLEMKETRERSSVKNIWCRSTSEREKKGGCVSNVKLVYDTPTQENTSGQVLVQFQRVDPTERTIQDCLSVKDAVVVSCEELHHIAIATGIVSDIQQDKLTLLLDRDMNLQPEYQKSVFCIDKADIYNSSAILFNNLSRLMSNTSNCQKLRELIIDRRKPEFNLTMSKGLINQVKPIFKPLNKPQKTAILKVLMCNDYVLIKGFPGTGKTSTIVALVTVLDRLGYSVLLTSYTHSAVDNILLKLKQMEVDFVRLGRKDKIHVDILPHSAELLTENFTTVKQIKDFYDEKKIVATTCLGTNHVVFSQKQFDICIVDEASQVLLPACLGSFFVSDRFVLVGDPKQLPPVVQSKEARAYGMEESLFAALDEAGATYELTMQYRMNREIMELSNKTVYKNALVIGSERIANATLTLPDDSCFKQPPFGDCLWLKEALSTKKGHSVKFLNTDQVPALESHDGPGLVKNETEAQIVTIITATLLQAGVAAGEIGVITPYRNQVKLISGKLTSQLNAHQLEVNTVDQYQGRDKSVIIVSFVRSHNQGDVKVGELLKDWRRLNVAVTRAKHKLILIGSKSSLEYYEPIQNIVNVLNEDQMIQLPINAHIVDSL